LEEEVYSRRMSRRRRSRMEGGVGLRPLRMSACILRRKAKAPDADRRHLLPASMSAANIQENAQEATVLRRSTSAPCGDASARHRALARPLRMSACILRRKAKAPDADRHHLLPASMSAANAQEAAVLCCSTSVPSFAAAGLAHCARGHTGSKQLLHSRRRVVLDAAGR
jgi:hypothetical protein